MLRKSKSQPKEKKENNLYKFSYYGNEKENVKSFLNSFKSFDEAITFIDNLVSVAIENYPLIKTIYFNQTVNDKYEDDDDIDDVADNFEPLFTLDKLKTVNGLAGLKTLLSNPKKKIATSYLTKYKILIDTDNDYKKKLNLFIEILKDGNFYIISNKEKIKEIEVSNEFLNLVLNNNNIGNDNFLENISFFHSVINAFNETKKAKRSSSTNELNFINKLVMLKNKNQKIIIEESKKKMILENNLNKFSYNFIAFKTEKKLKKKTLQIFEMLNDENKITLIKNLI